MIRHYIHSSVQVEITADYLFWSVIRQCPYVLLCDIIWHLDSQHKLVTM